MPITARRVVRTRLAAIAGLSAVIAAALVGCTSGSGDDSGQPSGKLQVLVSSGAGSDKAFRALNADFEKQYPGIKVVFKAAPNDAFSAARSSRLTAGNLDVTLGQPVETPKWAGDIAKGDDATAADAGLFLDLTGKKFLDNFTPSVIDSLKYNGKSYTVPTGLSYYTGVYYNKKIFADNEIKVPTTWTEFKAAAAKLEAAGVAPIGIGGKEGWPAGLMMQAVIQSMYPTKADKVDLASGIYDGSIKLTGDKQVQVLQRVKDLYDLGQKNFTGVSIADIPGDFAKGQFAMTIDGTWDSTTMASAVGNKFDFGYFPLPATDDADNNKIIAGKVELRMVAAANAPNKDAALKYLEFFSQPKEYAKFVGTAGFAPAEPNIASSDFLKAIQPYTKTFEQSWDGVWVVNSKAGPAAQLAFNYAGIAPLGTGTVQDAAQAAQNDWNAAG